MRVATYLRISKRDGSQTLENQHQALKNFIRLSGLSPAEAPKVVAGIVPPWEQTREYLDEETGATSDRPGFKQMLADAEKRKFDVLVFFSLDRLTREGAYRTLHYLNLLSSWGIAYRSYTEQYLDTCGIFKDAVVSILGTIAQQERVRISERVRAGQARAVSQGKKIGKRPLRVDIAAFQKANQVMTVPELCEAFRIKRSSVYKLRRGIAGF